MAREKRRSWLLTMIASRATVLRSAMKRSHPSAYASRLAAGFPRLARERGGQVPPQPGHFRPAHRAAPHRFAQLVVALLRKRGDRHLVPYGARLPYRIG